MATIETATLPQHFAVFERAHSFAMLRGWAQGRVRVSRDADGMYRVWWANDPKGGGCPDAVEVAP